MARDEKVDNYIARQENWEDALLLLREIALSFPSLSETSKWGIPVYTIDGKNLLGLAAFKSYVGIWFFQGALLQDKHQKLVNAKENETKAQRQWRFQSKDEIDSQLVKSYIEEAIENHRAGKELKPEKNKPLIIPPELKEIFSEDKKLEETFSQMSLTKQREFSDYIIQAKRAETKQQRLKKIIPMIMGNIGLHDKYKK